MMCCVFRVRHGGWWESEEKGRQHIVYNRIVKYKYGVIELQGEGVGCKCQEEGLQSEKEGDINATLVVYKRDALNMVVLSSA